MGLCINVPTKTARKTMARTAKTVPRRFKTIRHTASGVGASFISTTPKGSGATVAGRSSSGAAGYSYRLILFRFPIWLSPRRSPIDCDSEAAHHAHQCVCGSQQGCFGPAARHEHDVIRLQVGVGRLAFEHLVQVDRNFTATAVPGRANDDAARLLSHRREPP